MRVALTISLIAAAVAVAIPMVGKHLAHHKNIFNLKNVGYHHVWKGAQQDDQKYLFCKDDKTSYLMKKGMQFMIIRNPQFNDDYPKQVIGTPVGVLLIDTNAVGHLYTKSSPTCVPSEGRTS